MKRTESLQQINPLAVRLYRSRSLNNNLSQSNHKSLRLARLSQSEETEPCSLELNRGLFRLRKPSAAPKNAPRQLAPLLSPELRTASRWGFEGRGDNIARLVGGLEGPAGSAFLYMREGKHHYDLLPSKY
jgi:hypothetical protein